MSSASAAAICWTEPVVVEATNKKRYCPKSVLFEGRGGSFLLSLLYKGGLAKPAVVSPSAYGEQANHSERMAPVYDFRHVELDKVGRGKRMVKAPESNDIFGVRSPELGPSSPRKVKNYQQSSVFTGNEDTTPSRRRLSADNSQERLFGAATPSQDTPRRAVDRMKSNIFTGTPEYDGYSSNGSNSPSPPNGRVQ